MPDKVEQVGFVGTNEEYEEYLEFIEKKMDEEQGPQEQPEDFNLKYKKGA